MNILPILLIAGAGLLVLGGNKSSKASGSTKPATGIIYKCDYIKLVDKDKFKIFADDYIAKNFDTKSNGFSLYTFLAPLIQKLSPTCYKKFVDQTLNSEEKIILLLFAWYFVDAIPEKVFGITKEQMNNFWDNPELTEDQKNLIQMWIDGNHFSKFRDGLKLDKNAISEKLNGYLETFWQLNSSYFPNPNITN